MSLVYQKSQDGALNTNAFMAYLNKLQDKCEKAHYDIQSNHCNGQLSNSFTKRMWKIGWKKKRLELQFLPQYSPMLNPIKECFSVFKSRVKELLASDEF